METDQRQSDLGDDDDKHENHDNHADDDDHHKSIPTKIVTFLHLT